MASDALTKRIALEKENRGLLERVAFTWTEGPNVQAHAARNRRPLTPEQREENNAAFYAWLERWAGNRLRDTNNAIVGDHIVIFSRGAVRVGIIVKVGTKNLRSCTSRRPASRCSATGAILPLSPRSRCRRARSTPSGGRRSDCEHRAAHAAGDHRVHRPGGRHRHPQLAGARMVGPATLRHLSLTSPGGGS